MYVIVAHDDGHIVMVSDKFELLFKILVLYLPIGEYELRVW